MRHVIFVNRFFWPDHSATAQICSDLAFALADDPSNFDVHIVTSRQRYDDANARLERQENYRNVKIHRIWTSRFGRHNLFGRGLDYLSFYLSASVRLSILAQTGSVIIAKTDPPLISVPAALAAKLRSGILVNWIQDLFPEIAEELGVKLARFAPVSWLLLKVRNLSLRAARTNVVIGELMRMRLVSQGMDQNGIRVIPNWADGTQIKPIPAKQNPLRKEWELDGHFVVGYSGNFGRSHDFQTILDAATALRNRRYVRFLLIGGGANLPWVQQEIKRRGLQNIVLKPYQPRSLLSQSLSAADVHLVSLKPELEGLIVPSKFYGIAAAGRPVLNIGDETGEIARTIADARCGYTVTEGDGEVLARRIVLLAADRKRCNLFGLNARACLEQNFDKVPVFHRWQALLLGLR